MIEIRLEPSNNGKQSKTLINPTNLEMSKNNHLTEVVMPNGSRADVHEANDVTVLPADSWWRMWEIANYAEDGQKPEIWVGQHPVQGFVHKRDLCTDCETIKPISFALQIPSASSKYILVNTHVKALYPMSVSKSYFVSVNDEEFQTNILSVISDVLNLPNLKSSDLPPELFSETTNADSLPKTGTAE